MNVSTALLALALVPGATPLELPAPDEAAESAGAPEDKGFVDRYVDFLWGEIDRLGKLDIYGVSGQLPQGYLSIKWDWTTITAGSRYNAVGDAVGVMEPIEFTDDNGDKLISIDLGLSGEGGGHTFQTSYGITDPLDWYLELPFTHMNIRMNPSASVVDDEGNKISPSIAAMGGYDPQEYDVETFLYDTLPRLGRATPATGFRARWLLGDINTGFSWNYVRNGDYSASVVARVFLPTGKIQNANNSLFYGTGPALDTSTGGWAVGATQGFDWRAIKSEWFSAVLSTELTVGYAFEQQRPYPTNFVAPDPLLAALDPATFPDLSDLDGTFSYKPGWSVDWIAGLQTSISVLGLAAAFGMSHSQTPWLDGDPNFLSMVEGLELIGQQTLVSYQLGASVPLLPILPATLGVSWRKAVAGHNAIVFDDYWQMTIQGYLPVFLLWE